MGLPEEIGNPPIAYSAANAKAEQMYAVVKSIREFDKLTLAGVLGGIINPSHRENCFLGTYYRTAANVDSLLALNSGQHFQTAAVVARSLYELAVDVHLIDKVPQAWMKMVFFVDVEKLRVARSMVNFAAANPDRKIDVSAQNEFITKRAAAIEGNRKTLWPQAKKLNHWSAMNLPDRAKLLGDPFDELYYSHYARMSWYVHSGLTGIMNLPSDFFPMVHGSALSLSIACYSKILEAVIKEMKLNLADDKIYNTLKYATLLPFSKSPADELAFLHELLG
jgi:hypothetical protein